MVVILLDVLEQMQKNRIRRVAVKDMPVLLSVGVCGVKYMTEKLLAERLEQEVLGFKMGVKSSPANVGLLDDLADSDLVDMLL